ncbi:MAG: histidine phosphatase family protein [Chloroflexi bacterium]|nr:histidine phosphatase family protein [Chloroflexota bacterium]
MIPTTIYLVRHAESEANAAGTFSGHSDPLLTERGRLQALALARRFQDEAIDQVVSSDLQRALETAKLLASGLDLEVMADARLREMDFGDWEGLTQEKIAEKDADAWESILKPTPDFRAPGGESLRELRERMHAAYRDVVDAQPEGSAVVVAHGNAIGMLLGALLDMPYAAAWRFRLENTGVTTVQDFDGSPVLMSLNDTAHLSGLE